MGVPAGSVAGPGVLSVVHQVVGQTEGGVQAGGQQGSVEVVGRPQEQARHELRDHGQGPEVLLPEGHPRQGGRPEARLPVRRHPTCWVHQGDPVKEERERKMPGV